MNKNAQVPSDSDKYFPPPPIEIFAQTKSSDPAAKEYRERQCVDCAGGQQPADQGSGWSLRVP